MVNSAPESASETSPQPSKPEDAHSTTQRDPGDNWVTGPEGRKYWGVFGAAGLLAHDRERGVLLQLRSEKSHHGNTWGLPGGALHQGESAILGALRESKEEAGVPADAVHPVMLSTFTVSDGDKTVWSYTTVVAEVVRSFEPVISDAESKELAWVPVEKVTDLDLLPSFAAAWPQLKKTLDINPAVVVDVANVMGANPDGWWRDRAGAATRLSKSIAEQAKSGTPASFLGLTGNTWFPLYCVIIEGQAKRSEIRSDLANNVEIVRAPGLGDDTIVDETARLIKTGHDVVVITNDRELTRRVKALGASVKGSGTLQRLLKSSQAAPSTPSKSK